MQIRFNDLETLRTITSSFTAKYSSYVINELNSYINY